MDSMRKQTLHGKKLKIKAAKKGSKRKRGRTISQIAKNSDDDQSSQDDVPEDTKPSENPLCLSKRREKFFCRICHATGRKFRFIAPCMCKGSLNLVHKSCLETWLATSDSSHCELCGFVYRTKRLPKYMILSSIFAWFMCRSNRQARKQMIWDFLALTVMIPLMALCTVLGMKVASDVMTPDDYLQMGDAVVMTVLQIVLLTCVLILDLGVVSWAGLRMQYHFMQWYSWYRKNCRVVLLDYPDQATIAASESISSASVREINF